MPSELAYAVSKGALLVATPTLAEELADRGITVNCVNPGPTDTGWGLARDRPRRRMPGGRWGEPDDAARLGRLALQRRRALDHRPDHRLRGRVSPLDTRSLASRGTIPPPPPLSPASLSPPLPPKRLGCRRGSRTQGAHRPRHGRLVGARARNGRGPRRGRSERLDVRAPARPAPARGRPDRRARRPR